MLVPAQGSEGSRGVRAVFLAGASRGAEAAGPRLLQPLLEAAHRLQLADLLTVAVEAVVARLDSSNCLDAWNVGEHLGIAELSAGAKKVALKSFSPDLAALPAFAALPASLLEELLASDELAIKRAVRYVDNHTDKLYNRR